MSRGKTSRVFASNIDEKVKQLNKKIGRILGKKNNLRPNPKTSNFTFSLIIFIFTILFWLSTSLYYIQDGYNALLIKNGQVIKQVTGMKLGIFYPFPFGQVELFEATPSHLLDLDSIDKNIFYTKKNESINLDVKFSYLIINPRLTFETVTQNQDNLNSFVMNYVSLNVTNAVYNETNLVGVNYTVFANKIKDNINKQLTGYGISIVKLNLYKENALVTKVDDTAPIKNGLGEQIILEAENYRKNTLIDTKADIEQYNTLHLAYLSTPDAVIEQMYYDTLMLIPESGSNNYKLLDMPLSEFLNQQAITPSIIPSSGRVRNLSRDFIRERHLSGGAS